MLFKRPLCYWQIEINELAQFPACQGALKSPRLTVHGSAPLLMSGDEFMSPSCSGDSGNWVLAAYSAKLARLLFGRGRSDESVDRTAISVYDFIGTCQSYNSVPQKTSFGANTRWREFVDIYVLTGRFAIKAQALKSSMQRVAQFRNAELAPLRTALNGYAEIAQTRWRAWLRKQRLDNTIPTDFSIILEHVFSFADPLIVGGAARGDWNPIQGKWI